MPWIARRHYVQRQKFFQAEGLYDLGKAVFDQYRGNLTVPVEMTLTVRLGINRITPCMS
jgi:hypothetical protein